MKDHVVAKDIYRAPLEKLLCPMLSFLHKGEPVEIRIKSRAVINREIVKHLPNSKPAKRIKTLIAYETIIYYDVENETIIQEA